MYPYRCFEHRFTRENRRHFITRCLHDPATNYVPLRRHHIDKPESSVSPLIYDTTEEAASLTYAWAESGVGGYDELGTAFEVRTGTDTPAVDCSNSALQTCSAGATLTRAFLHGVSPPHILSTSSES